MVVMFPGSGLSKDFLGSFARGVAELGFVAFVADWGNSAQATGVVPDDQELVADTAQGACAVAFAQSNAARYGGDPVTDEQELLFAVLKAQGNPVSLDVMPGSSHTYLSDVGRKVFLAAFGKAVAD